MPPRFAYWTIILDGIATSFRAHDRAEILPIFNQLKKKDPAALLKWFSGGKLWDSPEQAKELRALERVRQFREERKNQAHDEHERGSGEDPLAEFRKQHGRPVDGSDDPSLRGGGAAPPATKGPAGEGFGRDEAGGDSRNGGAEAPRDKRRRDWRPGGEHKDPRDKYKLPPGEARKRWKDRNLGPRSFGSKPGGDRPFGSKPGSDRPFGDRPRGPKPFGAKPGGPRKFGPKPGGDRPFGDRPRGPKPFGAKPGGPRKFGPKPGGDRPFGDRPRGPKPFGSKPGGDRPFGDRPRGPKPFGSKPGGDRPFGDRPRGPKPFGSKPGGDRPFRGKPSGPGGPRPFGGKPGGQRSFGGPSTRDGQNRSLRAGKPRGPGRRGPK